MKRACPREASTVLGGVLAVMVLSLWARTAFGFCSGGILNPLRGYPEHQSITRKALQSPNAATYGVDAADRTWSFQPSALQEIIDANVNTDDTGAEAPVPWAHFDNEMFESADRRVADLRDLAVLRASQCEFRRARRIFGRALHTMQDFYSHSNWVPMGNDAPYLLIGSRMMHNPSPGTAVCETVDGATLLPDARVRGGPVTTGYWEHACPPRLSTQSVVRSCSPKRCGDMLVDTSSYGIPLIDYIAPEECDVGNDLACRGECDLATCQCTGTPGTSEPPGWTNGYLIPPEGKCLHGVPLGSGLNKDCEPIDGAAARDVARDATLVYWTSVKDALMGKGKDVLCLFYGGSARDCLDRPALVNGGFDTSPPMNGWSTLGDSSAIGGLTSVPELRPPSFPAMNLLRSNGAERASPSDVEVSLGLPAGGLASALGAAPTLGSVSYQVLLGHQQGAELAFSWNLLASTGAGGAGAHNAFAFLIVCKLAPGGCKCDPDEDSIELAIIDSFANARQATRTTSNSFFRQTGWTQKTYELPYAGDSIVTIGLIDVDDTFGAHLLVVDDVSVQ